MHNTLLFGPVMISMTPGEKIEISSLSEMRDFLEAWPPARRGLSYGTAAEGCEARGQGMRAEGGA
ncbi:DUF982 domain-containing protein [Mesorhizobium sp. IMUNJ 23232]|uniref:DUF982 domain-containing protein n=1 Tax=Mesorhizobium sp. IMUNJ 23232 TaxID=3376064 RepID=UPI003797BA14